MRYETIKVEKASGFATISLNRPERLNSFTAQMHRELRHGLADANDDESIRCIVLTGSGRAFCAGQDLSDRGVDPGDEPVDLGRSVEEFYNPLIRTIAALPVPVICAVNGVAAGAGANIAFACDMVIAAHSAKFIQSFAHIGLIPDSGGTWHLPRLVGHARAMGLALTGDPISAEEAERWGLIWKSVPDDQLRAEANALAQRFASGPTRGLGETKRRVREAWSMSLDAELDAERDAMRMLGQTADYREGVAAFTEKRKPVFKGR